MVFVVDLIEEQSDDFAKVLYTWPSRAQVLLYTFTIKKEINMSGMI